jgi:DNA-binding NtrC family response regulator
MDRTTIRIDDRLGGGPTVYGPKLHIPVSVFVADPRDRRWIESALAGSVELAFIDAGTELLAKLPRGPGGCLILSCDEDETATLQLLRDLRKSGNTLPTIVLGPHSAFRTAVSIARMEATEFLERPVAVRQLRIAVRRAGAFGSRAPD